MMPQYWPPAGIHDTWPAQPRSTGVGASGRTPPSSRLEGPPPAPLGAPPPPPAPVTGNDDATRAHESGTQAKIASPRSGAAPATVAPRPRERRDDITSPPRPS